jgi:hypothetical protein
LDWGYHWAITYPTRSDYEFYTLFSRCNQETQEYEILNTEPIRAESVEFTKCYIYGVGRWDDYTEEVYYTSHVSNIYIIYIKHKAISSIIHQYLFLYKLLKYYTYTYKISNLYSIILTRVSSLFKRNEENSGYIIVDATGKTRGKLIMEKCVKMGYFTSLTAAIRIE